MLHIVRAGAQEHEENPTRDPQALCAQAALRFLGYLVVNNSDLLGNDEQHDLIRALLANLTGVRCKNTVNLTLWCLSQQRFRKEIVAAESAAIIHSIQSVLCTSVVDSMTVQHEAVRCIAHLQIQIPAAMSPLAAVWGQVLLQRLASPAVKVRELAEKAFNTGLEDLTAAAAASSFNTGGSYVAVLCATVKNSLAPALRELWDNPNDGQLKRQLYVLRIWPLLVRVLGARALLDNAKVFQALLDLLSPAFSGSNNSPEVVMAAYDSWSVLIAVTGVSAKRLGMLLIPLKKPMRGIAATHPGVTRKRIEAWWQLVCKLPAPASKHFDQVCIPLLKVCFSLDGDDKPAKVTAGSSGMGLEILSGLLGSGNELAEKLTPRILPRISTPPSLRDAGQWLLPNLKLIAAAIRAGFAPASGTEVVAADRIPALALESLSHLGRLLGSGAGTDGVIIGTNSEQDRLFKTVFQIVIDIATQKLVPSTDVLAVLSQLVRNVPCRHFTAPSCKIAAPTDLKLPIEAIGQLLFMPGTADNSNVTAEFLEIFDVLLSAACDSPKPLALFHYPLVQLEQACSTLSLTTSGARSSLSRAYVCAAKKLTHFVQRTGEISTGSEYEPNYSLLIRALCLPLRHLVPLLPQSKDVYKHWRALFAEFSQRGVLSNTMARSNQHIEALSAELYKIKGFGLRYDASSVYADVLIAVLKAAEPEAERLESGLSPRKVGSSYVGGLVSLIRLLGQFCTETNPVDFTSLARVFDAVPGFVRKVKVQSTIRALLSALVSPIGAQLAAVPKGESALKTAVLGAWMEVASIVKKQYNANFANELNSLSPLFEVPLMHRTKKIRGEAVALWNATIGREAWVNYPEALKPVIAAVVKRYPKLLRLPGWERPEGQEMEPAESGAGAFESQESTQDSQPTVAAPQPILSMVATKDSKRSFLARTQSPIARKGRAAAALAGRPRGLAQSMTGESTSHTKASRNRLNSEDDHRFVKIDTIPRKRGLLELTEHQNEVKERRKEQISIDDTSENWTGTIPANAPTPQSIVVSSPTSILKRKDRPSDSGLDENMPKARRVSFDLDANQVNLIDPLDRESSSFTKFGSAGTANGKKHQQLISPPPNALSPANKQPLRSRISVGRYRGLGSPPSAKVGTRRGKGPATPSSFKGLDMSATAASVSPLIPMMTPVSIVSGDKSTLAEDPGGPAQEVGTHSSQSSVKRCLVVDSSGGSTTGTLATPISGNSDMSDVVSETPAVFALLADCMKPVDKIIGMFKTVGPQGSSKQALVQVLAGRQIRTVGDLCSLSTASFAELKLLEFSDSTKSELDAFCQRFGSPSSDVSRRLIPATPSSYPPPTPTPENRHGRGMSYRPTGVVAATATDGRSLAMSTVPKTPGSAARGGRETPVPLSLSVFGAPTKAAAVDEPTRSTDYVSVKSTSAAASDSTSTITVGGEDLVAQLSRLSGKLSSTNLGAEEVVHVNELLMSMIGQTSKKKDVSVVEEHLNGGGS